MCAALLRLSLIHIFEENTEEDNWRFVERSMAMEPMKPVIDGEPVYEEIPHGLHEDVYKRQVHIVGNNQLDNPYSEPQNYLSHVPTTVHLLPYLHCIAK